MKQREYDQAFNVLGNTLCQDPENPKALLTLAAEMQVSDSNRPRSARSVAFPETKTKGRDV